MHISGVVVPQHSGFVLLHSNAPLGHRHIVSLNRFTDDEVSPCEFAFHLVNETLDEVLAVRGESSSLAANIDYRVFGVSLDESEFLNHVFLVEFFYVVLVVADHSIEAANGHVSEGRVAPVQVHLRGLLGSLVDLAFHAVLLGHIKGFLPTVRVAFGEVFLEELIEVALIQVNLGGLRFREVAFLSRGSVSHATFVALHASLELFEIGEGEESFDCVGVGSFVRRDVGAVFEVQVEGIDLVFRVGFLELGLDDVIQDVDVLLEDSGVLQLVLIGVEVELVFVLLEEGVLRRGEVGLGDELADGVEDLHFLGVFHGS
mmetsp:Transcript_2637/g.4096  ORF Transcript_2637/g.4096 Transcript_2637/m.4096 type:complete len:316 (-) Transcript_2637:9-956(-)